MDYKFNENIYNLENIREYMYKDYWDDLLVDIKTYKNEHYLYI
jgi:hypothetical protein